MNIRKARAKKDRAMISERKMGKLGLKVDTEWEFYF